MKVILVAGARPNFMKIAPIVNAIAKQNATKAWGDVHIESRLVHTGQHYDIKMSEIFFQELGLPHPDINLEVGSGSHATQTANVILKFEQVCLQEKPDWVIVVGDVNSTMACTIVAAKLGIKVAHVEAGLRSFDRTMPEELNRLVTDALADLLLPPSEDGIENLLKEGVAREKIELVGNVMIDSLIENLPKSRQSKILETTGVEKRKFAYVTLHRPSNVDTKESLSKIISELKKLTKHISVVFPIHPRTRQRLKDFGINVDDTPALHILEPLGYHDSLCLTENARLLLTDSGGLQEESTYFRTPCLTLRPNTERPITVSVGSNKLTRLDTLHADLAEILNGPETRGQNPEFWDGKSAERIIKSLFKNA